MSAASFEGPRQAAASPVGLILAAGAGRRLGRGPKALLLLRGVPLVEHVARALREGGCAEVVVVTGAGAEGVDAVMDGMPWARTEQNPRWREGMGTSLRTGLAAIGPGRDVLVTPVDRPGTCAAEVARVLAAHRPGGITAAAHREASGELRRGHPVLLDAAWTTAAAEAAHADVGARDLLRARRDHVQLVDCTDLDDGADLDLPEDLWRLDVRG